MRYRDEWFPEPTWGPWFRGQRCADWPLQPSFYRYYPQPWPVKHGQRNLDAELQQEFVMRAPSLTNVHPQNPWEWYFLMQHSGAPTRLLDWTEGALIGLYFAIRDNEENENAAVWLLDPWWLNKQVVRHSEVIPPGAHIGMAKADAKRYQRWLPDRFKPNVDLPDLPVAVYASHIAPRISTQRSCFTVHGSQIAGLEHVADNRKSRLIKVTIDHGFIKKMRQELVTCGIDEVTIYPDVDGLGRSLTTVLKVESSQLFVATSDRKRKRTARQVATLNKNRNASDRA
jgi:hypothetical protein